MREKLSNVKIKISKTLFDTKMFLKNKGNKYQALFSLFGLLISVTAVVGISYAVWTDSAETGNNSISTGVISLRYVEDTSFATINNAEPMTANEAYQSNNYFPFQVVMQAGGEVELDYEVTITTKDTTTYSYDTDQKIRLGLKKENNIVTDGGFTLEGGSSNVDYTNGIIVGTLPTTGTSLTGNPQTIYKGKISVTNSQETVHSFKLYLWLDSNVEPNTVSEKYALTININTGDSNPNYQKYTLTYTDDEGVGCNIKQVRKNTPWGELCVPTVEDGYTFHGWYTGEDGTGTQITSTTVASSNQTVYAYYTPKTLYAVLKDLAEQGTYASTYSGNDTNDTYGEIARKPVYYIRTSTADNETQAATILNSNTDIISGSGIRGINVKFAGFCWQIFRTTDTGGVKLIYNGEYVNGTGCKAHNTTDTHKGIISSPYTSGDMAGDYMYSDTFTYNTSTSQFTLVNPVVKNWSNASDKEYILGKYTCKTSSTTSTCSTIYFVNTPHRTTANYVHYASYTIGDTQNAQIGKSPINANGYSPAYVGYSYGDTAYGYVNPSYPTSGSIMGNTVYWNGTNYELRESDGTTTSTGTRDNDTHHYTCNTTSATCTGGKVRYYYYNEYYTELTGGDKIEDAISKMLTNVENKHDSAMKAYLENWYYNNLINYEDYIEQDAVYCNDRSISDLGGWSKDGSRETTLKFNNYNTITSLGCTNNIDKFSVSNTSAQLKYPIGLADAPEMNLINNSNIRKTSQNYWLVSPPWFSNYHADSRRVAASGSFSTDAVYGITGVRPVITLKASVEYSSGNGSMANPYVIGN